MATPHVTGAAALLSAYNPNLSPASLKATLMNTVDLLAQWNGVVKTGGRLNVDRALQKSDRVQFQPFRFRGSHQSGRRNRKRQRHRAGELRLLDKKQRSVDYDKFRRIREAATAR